MHNEKVLILINEDRQLDFRKIPLLNYKYEINFNRTILRNIKLQREIKIKLDHHHSKDGYYPSFIFLIRK
jgi:hypothetical protein